MSYNAILDDNLYVGDYEAAKDIQLLTKLGVTHIVACGFESGYFQNLRKFRYFCIDIIDSPSSNILQYLPRVVKFIEKAIEKENGVVYVHCVHGQSRSCAVCLAFLMHKFYQAQYLDFFLDKDMSSNYSSNNGEAVTNLKNTVNLDIDLSDDMNLLHFCYDKVMSLRPQIAINPGFMKQLEIFRQMKSSFSSSRTISKEQEHSKSNVIQQSLFIQSNAHAYFRSCRSKSEFQYHGHIDAKKFCPLLIENQNETVYQHIYQCQNCGDLLFTEKNLIFDLSVETISRLPVSDYWKDSKGGIEYLNSKSSSKSKDYCSSILKLSFGQLDSNLKVEPMRWMEKQICNGSYQGSLDCPNCSCSLGYWDWMNRLDLPTVVVVLKSKVL